MKISEGNEHAIRNLIFKFANSVDLKQWDVMQGCLSAQVDCDYTSLRKTKEILSSQEYVSLRARALEHLKTQHLFSNLEITISGVEANCRCTALILRKFDEDFFNTHAFYEFTCFYQHEIWVIGKIKQVVLWNEGNPTIHAGVSSSS